MEQAEWKGAFTERVAPEPGHVAHYVIRYHIQVYIKGINYGQFLPKCASFLVD